MSLGHPISIRPPYESIYNLIDRANADSANSLLSRSLPSSIFTSFSSLIRQGFLRFPCTIPFDHTFAHIDAHSDDLSFLSDLYLSIFRESTALLELLSHLSFVYPLENISVIKVTSETNMGSDFWHRDGVGTRLKVFVPICYSGCPPSTSLLSGSNHLGVYPRNWEMLRSNKEFPHLHPFQRDIETYYSIFPIYTHHWSADFAFILDTNSVHRADTFHPVSDNSFGSRIFFCLEFMDSVSSFTANKYRLGTCSYRTGSSLMSLLPNLRSINI